jgi:transcriptional regulator with XRE-family HTH domain
MQTFGKRMQYARRLRGLSQAELARRLGMPRQQVNNYEKDRFDPSLEVAKRIADALEVSLDALTGRTGLPGEDAIAERMPAAVA